MLMRTGERVPRMLWLSSPADTARRIITGRNSGAGADLDVADLGCNGAGGQFLLHAAARCRVLAGGAPMVGVREPVARLRQLCAEHCHLRRGNAHIIEAGVDSAL